jgi:hypothetical protein
MRHGCAQGGITLVPEGGELGVDFPPLTITYFNQHGQDEVGLKEAAYNDNEIPCNIITGLTNAHRPFLY